MPASQFKIGILECDHFEDELRVKYGTYGEMFQKLLLSVAPHLTFKVYKTLYDQYPQDLNECDAYLITGSKYSVYESLTWIKKLQNFVYVLHQHQKKLVGICFGHQIVAKALDGQVSKYPDGWGVGTYASQLAQIKPWMEPALDHFRIIVSHQDQVMQLPKQAELVATNEFCKNSAFQIGEHILCFQGHPEFIAEYAYERMLTRKHLIGEDKLKAGMESLKKPTNEIIVAKWITNFFKIS